MKVFDYFRFDGVPGRVREGAELPAEELRVQQLRQGLHEEASRDQPPGVRAFPGFIQLPVPALQRGI